MSPEQRSFAAKMFGAVSNTARIQILECLSQGPASVTQIAKATGLKQPAASQQLAVLLSAGLILCRPNGNFRVYGLRGPRLPEILRLAEEFYEVHLESLRDLLERQPGNGTNQVDAA